jgi:DNA-binding transcriptional regulator YiaG
MNPAPIGEALYGPRWRTELARALGVAERTVRRWEAAGELPEGYRPEVRDLVQKRIASLRALSPRS